LILKKKFFLSTVLALSLAVSNLFIPATSAESNEDKHGEQMKETVVNYMKAHKKAVDEAVENGEKLYTFEDILKLNHKDLGIEAKELAAIKATVKEAQKTLKQMEKEHKNDPAILGQIELYKDRKYAASELVIVDADKDKIAEGETAGYGWPNCVDDNGFGPGRFIGSDCDFGLLKYCLKDVWGTMTGDTSVRRCKPWIPRNCSPDIGHSKYHHHHWNTWPHSH
jgi:hypothetical protein